MCQDTDKVVACSAEAQAIHIAGGAFKKAITKGNHEAYDVGYRPGRIAVEIPWGE